MSSTMTLRLSGPGGSIEAMLDMLRGSPDVDHVVEMDAADMPKMSDDSSSAELPDDVRGGGRDVEVHAVDEAALERVRDGTEMAARKMDVLVEWRERL